MSDRIGATVNQRHDVSCVSAHERASTATSERTPDNFEPLFSRAMVVLDLDQFVATCDGRYLRLTPLEFDILAYLMRQSHRVVSHEELVREVVHGFFRPGSSVIRVHLSHLREKLGSDAWVIATIRGRGVRFVESPVSQ